MKWLFSIMGVLALSLQVLTGSVSLHLFAFPTNLMVLILLLYLVWMDYRFAFTKSRPAALATSSAVVFALMSLLAGMLILGLFPQTE
ncbi:MAG: hypothetical protein PHT87_04390, partial [Bacteroidales bacterium]|nr:hypothetical protein [Bacteroidales bacterium]